MSVVDIVGVSKRYETVVALDAVSLTFGEGEFFGLLGPSGSGKTTLLRAIAGFVQPDAGEIRFDGEDIRAKPVHRRDIGMVFQSYALFPHMSVFDNVAFGLTVRGRRARQVKGEVERMLGLVRLSGLEARRPSQLSGGQQQRVALARALITRPRVLLLDEPLGALDKRLRQQMQIELRQIQREVGITTVFVTHDQEEALTLSDRLAVMFAGRIAQIGRPEEIYQQPASRAVAEFIGGMNFLPCTLAEDGPGTLTLDVRALGRATVPRPPGLNGSRELTVGVRPERLTLLVDQGATAAHRISGRVTNAAYYGDMTYYYVELPGLAEPLIVSMRNTVGRRILQAGETVEVGWAPESLVPLG